MSDKNKVLNFIDAVNKEKQSIANVAAYKNTPMYKKGQMESNKEKAKDTCLAYIFFDVFKNSIPLENQYIYSHADDLEKKMKIFMNEQIANKGLTCYVRETIKNGNTSMKELMESVDRFVENCFREKAANIENLSADDLNWTFDDEKKEQLDSFARDANLDDISEYIKANVKNAIESEKKRVEERRLRTSQLQSELENNDDMVSESAINRRLALEFAKEGKNKIYQPSLFEAVMIHSFNNGDSDSEEGKKNCFCEAVAEFTLLNMNKAFRFKNYSRMEVNNLANKYAK